MKNYTEAYCKQAVAMISTERNIVSIATKVTHWNFSHYKETINSCLCSTYFKIVKLTLHISDGIWVH